MWLYANNAFLSIVEWRDDENYLLVRARFPTDINAVFPNAQVHETPSADYRYRAVIERDEVAEAMARQAYACTYDNFKNSIPHSDRDRHDTYLACWMEMKRAQDRAHSRYDDQPDLYIDQAAADKASGESFEDIYKDHVAQGAC